jgi:cell pole-organizing protein PopZ
MDDLVASLRRIILSDEEASAEHHARMAWSEPEVLTLDPSMMVTADLENGEPENAEMPHPPEAAPPDHAEPEPPPVPEPAMIHVVAQPVREPVPLAIPVPASEPAAAPRAENAAPAPGLVTPQAAAAAASAVGSLLRTLGAHRQSLAVSRGGPTLEDIVRDELRPVLKAWLDEHLPGLVERLVRAEIERVVGQASDL